MFGVPCQGADLVALKVLVLPNVVVALLVLETLSLVALKVLVLSTKAAAEEAPDEGL